MFESSIGLFLSSRMNLFIEKEKEILKLLSKKRIMGKKNNILKGIKKSS